MSINRSAVGASLTMALLIAAHAASAQTGFNGAITFRTNSRNGSEGTLVQITKGNRLRLEMDKTGSSAAGGQRSGAGAIIIDGDAHTTTILTPERKQYIRVDAAQMKQMEDMMSSMGGGAARARLDSVAKASDMHIAKTGRTEVVAGVKCDVYHGSGTRDGKPTEGDVCVADGVGFSPFAMVTNGAMMGRSLQSLPQFAQFRDLLKGGSRGILKITSTVDGKTIVDLEATAIDRTPPSDAAFLPPAEYTKMEMPGMFGRPSRP